jgi:hypothetical protein
MIQLGWNNNEFGKQMKLVCLTESCLNETYKLLVCLNHSQFWMVWNKDTLYHQCSQLCFRMCSQEGPRK